MASWFEPGASTASWFAQPTGNPAAAAATSPQPSSGFSPLLGAIFGQTSTPAQQPAPPPVRPAPSSGGIETSPLPGLVGQVGRPIAGALGSDYSSGLGAALGLTNLGLGASSGNIPRAIGGGLSTVGSLSNLLNSSPNLASSLGLGELGTAGSGIGGMSALGSIGAGAGGLGGLLGIYGGVNGLMNGGSVPSSLMQLGTGLGGTYGALSSLFPSVFPSATAAISSAVPSLAPAFAGAAAAAPVLGMVAGPYVVAQLMQLMTALGPDKANARQLGIRVDNIQHDLPGQIQRLADIPGITSQLTSTSTPDQAASILKQLNDTQSQFQAGGWEDYLKSGSTSVAAVGNKTSMTAQLPQVQAALSQMQPYLAQLDVARVRAEDLLMKAGWTPDQIQAQTGRYIDPMEWALNANAQSYSSRGVPYAVPGASDFNPTLSQALRPNTLQTNQYLGNNDLEQQIQQGLLVGSDPANLPAGARAALGLSPTVAYTNQDLANFFGSGGAGTGLVSQGKFGNTVNGVRQQFESVAPGTYEQSLAKLLAPYGGINPLWQALGFGQGLS
jgi:hypothetical protein